LSPNFAPVDFTANYVLERVKEKNQALTKQLARLAELLDQNVDRSKYAVAGAD
jgi:hypothetical protein